MAPQICVSQIQICKANCLAHHHQTFRSNINSIMHKVQSAHNSCIVIKIISNKCSTSSSNSNSSIPHPYTRTTTQWIMEMGSLTSYKSNSQCQRWVTTLHPLNSTITIINSHHLVEASILFCHLVGQSQLVHQAAKANSHIKPCRPIKTIIMRQMAWGNHNSWTLVRCSNN